MPVSNSSLEVPIVGVQIALDRVDVENGCKVVLPGSHLKGPHIRFLRHDYQIGDRGKEEYHPLSVWERE